MTFLALLSKLLDLILRVIDAWKAEKLREEGRAEIRRQIEQRNDEQAQTAERVREAVSRAPLSELEQRMRKYQRSTED